MFIIAFFCLDYFLFPVVSYSLLSRLQVQLAQHANGNHLKALCSLLLRKLAHS